MNYQEIIDKPVSKLTADKILSMPFERSIFLNEYRYFRNDGNKSTYKDFISKVLNRKRVDSDLLSDVIYLAIDIKFYSRELLDEISKMLLSKKDYLIRLACLDYLNSFRRNIDKSVYLRLNQGIFRSSKNTLLRLQSLINLMSLDRDKYFPLLSSILEKETMPTVFYRLINGLKAGNIKLKSEEKRVIIQMIKENSFDRKVKSELVSGLE